MNIDLNKLRAPWDHAVTVRGTTIALLCPVDVERALDQVDPSSRESMQAFARRIVPEPMRDFIAAVSDGELLTLSRVYGQLAGDYFAEVSRGVAELHAMTRARPRKTEPAARDEEVIGPRPGDAPIPPLPDHSKRRWGETSGGIEGMVEDKDDGSDGIGS